MTIMARQFHLKSRPEGLPQANNFELVEQDLPAPERGQLLVANRWL